tara:strand:- start:2107 stop:2700 length:594 start_codon:yes stop_codon:yes gene_type:complete
MSEDLVGYMMSSQHKHKPTVVSGEPINDDFWKVISRMVGEDMVLTYKYNGRVLPDSVTGTPREITAVAFSPSIQEGFLVPYNEGLSTFMEYWGLDMQEYIRGKVFILTKPSNEPYVSATEYQKAFQKARENCFVLELECNPILKQLKDEGHDVTELENCLRRGLLEGKEPTLEDLKKINLPLPALLRAMASMEEMRK